MERLLSDAQKLSGVEYDIDNLSDVYEAIHLIQGELGITGTTALEAAETLQGSASAMKAAFQNLIANLALGEDISAELAALKETVNVFFVDNLIPMLANILSKVPEIIGSIIDGAIGAIDYLGQSLAEKYPGFAAVFENLETIVVGLTAAFVAYKTAMAISGVIDIVKKSMAGLNLVMNANPIMLVVTLLAGLAAALITAYKTNDVFKAKVDSAFAMIRNTVSGVITSLKNWLTVTIPNSINISIQWFREMPGKVINAMSSLIGRMRTLGAQIFNSFKGGLGSFFNIGANLIRGLWNGISSVKNWILSKIGGFTKSVLNSVKSFFGIHSPSRVFRDEVGAMLGQGLALGIEDEVSTVSRAMDELQNATVRDMNSVMGIDTYSNASINSGFVGSTLHASLSLGERAYKLLVEDFTNEQDRQTELGLAY